jgi:hypothetical protein
LAGSVIDTGGMASTGRRGGGAEGLGVTAWPGTTEIGPALRARFHRRDGAFDFHRAMARSTSTGAWPRRLTAGIGADAGLSGVRGLGHGRLDDGMPAFSTRASIAAGSLTSGRSPRSPRR